MTKDVILPSRGGEHCHRACRALSSRWLVRTLTAVLGALLVSMAVALPCTAYAAIIDISLTKTASPTTYSAVGDVITYTYVIENTGDVTLASLTLDDDKIPGLSCALPFTLVSGASVTCTGTYAITSADIAAGSVTNVATATGLVADTHLQGPNAPVVDVADATGPRRNLWGSILEHLNPISTAHAQVASVTASAQTTVTYVPPDEKVELFDPRPQTSAVIERFLNHRLYGLLGDEPDRPRFIRRFPNSLWSGGPGGGGSPFNVTQSENGNQIAFSTSLSQMRQAAASADNNPLDDKAMSLGSAALNERPGPAPYGGFDVWTEAHFTNYNDTGGADGDFNILYVGADYAVNTNWLIGVLGQFDWAEESTKADGSKIDGDGWMVGPYVSGRLGEHLFFDWRAAWGDSDNGVTPFGTYTNSFDSDRWLTTARLTGNWVSGQWRLTPSVSVKYGEEQQDAYTDSLGFRIRGQDVSLGQIDFGPEIAYRWLLDSGTVVEPQLALYGVWNYEDSTLHLNNTVYTPDDFTGRLEGALQVYLPNGWSGRGAVAYDGIGSDYDAVTGKVWLNLPLN